MLKKIGGEKKKMNKTKKGIVAFLLTAALLVSAVGMASADPSLKWDLDKVDSSGDYVMWEAEHTETGSVTIASGNCKTWRADLSATPVGGVGFPAEVWDGRLTTNENLDGVGGNGSYTADIGYSDADGSNFVSNGVTGSQSVYLVSHGASLSYIDANAFTVPQGKYLALQVCNTGASSFTVTTTGSSYVVWPQENPDYPIPELSTLVLLSFGLLALFGYAGYRRRNNKK